MCDVLPEPSGPSRVMNMGKIEDWRIGELRLGKYKVDRETSKQGIKQETNDIRLPKSRKFRY